MDNPLLPKIPDLLEPTYLEISPRLYYKVVCLNMTSVNWCSEYSLNYEINKWMKPIIGKLFVFDDLECVKSFLGNISTHYKVFECEIVKAPFKLNICANLMEIEDFWRIHTEARETNNFTIFNWDRPNCLRNCPLGTVMADAVKLTKEITL